MANYAVVENGIVTNIVVWDGQSDWKPDSGEVILITDGAGIGWKYINGTFIAPDIPKENASNSSVG